MSKKDDLDWLILDLSQDIRFLMQFRIKRRKIERKQLESMHETLMNIKKIIEEEMK